MRSETTYIYGLEDPRSGDMFYVGKSICPKRRLSEHLRDRGNSDKVRYIDEMSQQGVSPSLVILQEISDKGWQEAERSWISRGRECGWPLTNIFGGRRRKNGRKDDFEFFDSFLPPKLREVFRGLLTADKWVICRATALAMLQHSYLAIKARGGNPKREFNVDFECLVGLVAANALVESVGDVNRFNELLNEIERKGSALTSQIRALISCYER